MSEGLTIEPDNGELRSSLEGIRAEIPRFSVGALVEMARRRKPRGHSVLDGLSALSRLPWSEEENG